MAKFKFRLATLLRLREATRGDRRTQLAQAYRADEIIQQQQDQLQQELEKVARQNRRTSAPGPVDVDRLLEGQRYEVALRTQQSHARGQREAVAAEIERRREALVQANRGVRVLEELRQKQAQRHRQEENRLEIKQLDDVTQRRGAEEDA